MGKRAPHTPSIVDGFFQLPELPYVVGSVAPVVCLPVLAAAQASLAGIGEDAQNGSRLATTLGELIGVGTAEPSPSFDEPTQLFHGGWSDSPAR
jgi:hypothetical protein